jgi:hypothetical protein
MKMIAKDAINPIQRKGRRREVFPTLKKNSSLVLFCVCAYSGNSYSEVPDISTVTQLQVTGVTAGQQIFQNNLPISIGASGIWNYEWSSTTAQSGLYPLTGTLFIDGQQAGAAQLASFPYGPAPGPISASQSFNTSFGSFGNLALGPHTASVQVLGSDSSPSVNFLVVVPEPETYAMLLAGLGLVGFMASRRQDKKLRPQSK